MRSGELALAVEISPGFARDLERGNAVRIVNAAPRDRDLLFVPDENLGAWVMEQTGRPMDLWQGSCYVHIEFTRESIEAARREYPDAKIVAHPECPQVVRLLADEVCSTEKMIGYCREHPAKAIIIVTEEGMLHRLRRELPGKTFLAGPTQECACAECRYMKLNTLEKLKACLETLTPEITLPEALRVGPTWLIVVIVAACATPPVVFRKHCNHLFLLICGHAAVGIVTLAMIGSLGLLVSRLPGHKETPGQLLRAAAALWITNVVVFAAWNWRHRNVTSVILGDTSVAVNAHSALLKP